MGVAEWAVDQVRDRTVETAKMVPETIGVPIKGVIEGTAAAAVSILKGTAMNDDAPPPEAPLAVVVNTPIQGVRRVARAAKKALVDIKGLHLIDAYRDVVGELGAGAVEVATAVPDAVASAMLWARNGVNRVLRGVGRAAVGVASLGKDIASDEFKTEAIDISSKLGTEGPYQGGEEAFEFDKAA